MYTFCEKILLMVWFEFIFGFEKDRRFEIMNTLAAQISDSLIDEIVGAVGLPKTHRTHAIFGHLFKKITNRMGVIGAKFDQISEEEGFPAASQYALTHFCRPAQVHGAEHIPHQGPLMVISNHPGTYDSLVLFASLEGHNIRCVTSVIPPLEALPHAHQYFLFTPGEDVRGRMLVLRRAINHLRDGGALVYFPAGHREPDPAVYSGGEESLDQWMDVFGAFFKHVEGLRILPAIVSGVISEKWAKHPIAWIRKKQIDKQRLAEFGQVMSQLIRPGKLMLTPRISFGPSFSLADLQEEGGSGGVFEAVIERVRVLFEESSAYFGDF
jgi:hypothetical protein